MIHRGTFYTRNRDNYKSTTDRVPLSTSALFLKFGELPPVVDGD